MKRCRPLLGTYVDIHIRGEADENVFSEAFNAIERVQQLMNFHDPDSELSSINRRAHLETLTLHPWTWFVLQQSIMLYHLTQGLFDCTATINKSRTTPSPGSMNDIVIKNNHRITSHRPLSLNLGGIAKGFAVDCAIETLTQHNITHAIVNAGGDLRVLGENTETIYIRHPHQPHQQILIGQISNGAVATSAIYPSHHEYPRPRHSHIVVPHTQQAITHISSHTVVAPSCLIADALTKVLAITQNPQADYFQRLHAHGICHV